MQRRRSSKLRSDICATVEQSVHQIGVVPLAVVSRARPPDPFAVGVVDISALLYQGYKLLIGSRARARMLESPAAFTATADAAY